MKRFFLTIFGLAIIAVLGTLSYYALDYVFDKESLQFQPIEIPGNASSTPVGANATSSEQIVTVEEEVLVGWKSFKSEELAFQVKYPPDLIFNDGQTSVILAFPKSVYFHWPLLDESKITIAVNPVCPVETANDSEVRTTLVVNGRSYLVTTKTEPAAGNIYTETVYHPEKEEVCHIITFTNRGANGAGLYVDNANLIKKYDDQHTADIIAVNEVLYGILASFESLSLPEGRDEAETR